MAKKHREILVTLPEEEDAPPETTPPEEVEQEESEINSILKDSQLGSGSYVWLLRKGPGEFNYAFIGEKIPVGDFSIEEIASQFGGGDYKGKVYRQPDKGAANIFRTLPPFKIDARKIGTRDKLLNRGGEPDKNETIMQMMSKLVDGRPDKDAGAGNIADMIKSTAKESQNQLMMMMMMMMESQKNMVQMFCALAGKPQQSGAELMPAIIGLIDSAKQSPMDLIKTMRGLKELSDDSGRDTPQDDESMLGLIKAFAAGVLPALQRGAPQPPGPGVAHIAGAPSTTSTDPGAFILQQFDGWVKRLARAAAQNSDPEIYYDLMLDQMDQSQVQQLREVLAREDVWTQIAQRPDVSQYASWFAELRKLILVGPEPELPAPAPTPEAK